MRSPRGGEGLPDDPIRNLVRVHWYRALHEQRWIHERESGFAHWLVIIMAVDQSTEAAPSKSMVLRAVEYVRMSTEHQQYSTENQCDKIREYASKRSLEIVRTYADQGKSGLRIDGREALQRLIHDVTSGMADFQVILVYDVSRWGRFLSGLIIDETEGMPSSAVYAYHFGSLIRAYQTVGFTPDRDYRYLEINRFLRQLHPTIITQTEQAIADLGGSVLRDPATDLLDVNREFTVSLVLSRCQPHENGRNHWKVRFDTSLLPDITVAVRLNGQNDAPLDYYLLPRLDFAQPGIRLAERNSIEYESYRFDTLDYLYHMAERAKLRRAA